MNWTTPNVLLLKLFLQAPANVVQRGLTGCPDMLAVKALALGDLWPKAAHPMRAVTLPNPVVLRNVDEVLALLVEGLN